MQRKLAVAAFTLAILAPVGAALPQDSPARMQRPSPPPRTVAVLPFRDEIFDTATEIAPSTWTSLGGQSNLDDRRRALLGQLARATPAERQRARWNYGRFLIDTGRPHEAIGVLKTMSLDEPGLTETAAFRGVLGIALVRARDLRAGIDALSHPELAAIPEACLWRGYAQELIGNAREAVLGWPCTAKAIDGPARHLFALSAARAAMAIGDTRLAMRIIDPLPRTNPEVMLLKGIALTRDGDPKLGDRLITKARDAARSPLKERAELVLVKTQLDAGAIPLRQAIKRLEQIRFAWRGGHLEQDILETLSHLYEKDGNARAAVATGATLVRYFDLGPQTSHQLGRLRAILDRALAPGSKIPLTARAGLYWDYRDLAPQGAGGDAVVRSLAEQIAAAGLYGRAAELLDHQIENRLSDDARDVVAIRAAQLHLLAGQPQRALDVLRKTDAVATGKANLAQRNQLTAFALLALGRSAEALNSTGAKDLSREMRAELLWHAREWHDYLEATAAMLPEKAASLSLPFRAIIVRRAVAAALAGDENEIGRLRSNYGAQLKTGELASAFQLVTGDSVSIDPASVQAAMRDIDRAVPADDAISWLTALSITTPKAERRPS